MSRVELLPCPFCGGPAGLVQCPPTGWKVSCHSTDFSGMTNRYNCAVGAETHVLPSKAEAIAAWNRRPGARAATAPAGDLADKLEQMAQWLDDGLGHSVLSPKPLREAAQALRYQSTGVTEEWIADRATLVEAALDPSLSDGAVRALVVARWGEITPEIEAWARTAALSAQERG